MQEGAFTAGIFVNTYFNISDMGSIGTLFLDDLLIRISGMKY